MLLVVVAVVVVAGIVIALFGWDRYSGNRKAVGDDRGAQPTAEVFVDPETGQSNAGLVPQGYRPPGVPSRQAI